MFSFRLARYYDNFIDLAQLGFHKSILIKWIPEIEEVAILLENFRYKLWVWWYYLQYIKVVAFVFKNALKSSKNILFCKITLVCDELSSQSGGNISSTEITGAFSPRGKVNGGDVRNDRIDYAVIKFRVYTSLISIRLHIQWFFFNEICWILKIYEIYIFGQFSIYVFPARYKAW